MNESPKKGLTLFFKSDLCVITFNIIKIKIEK